MDWDIIIYYIFHLFLQKYKKIHHLKYMEKMLIYMNNFSVLAILVIYRIFAACFL